MSCKLDAGSSNSYSFTGPNVHSTSIYRGKHCSLSVFQMDNRVYYYYYNSYIYIYSETCLILHTKGPGKCVGLYRMSEYSGFILVNRNTLGP
jgi:hypothetical protein